ncbi:MAG TPA: hypothetical protein VGB22_08530 [candidate division Zixibacteria bacterium]|jgi:Tfp pilus assembly PilM family ATPase
MGSPTVRTSATARIDSEATRAEARPAADSRLVESPDNARPRGLIHWEYQPPVARGRRIGIEFDGRNLIVVGVRPHGDGHAIDALSVCEWEETPDASTVAKTLREMISERDPIVDLVISAPRAVVRHFHLPPLPKRQLTPAARWEGQKLIPFSLEESESLTGTKLVRDGDDGWWVTLVAIPREDAELMLEAIAILGWQLHEVSLVGTQRLPDRNDGELESIAPHSVVFWSEQRGTFSVFAGGALRFHYDIGAMPAPPEFEGDISDDIRAAALRDWVRELGGTIADPFDFYLSKGSSQTPKAMALIGPPGEIAPMLDNWGSRFDTVLSVVNPLTSLGSLMPDHVGGWSERQIGMIAPAVLAACGRATVDLTPQPIKRRRQLLRLQQVARLSCFVSVGIVIASTLLQWNSVRQQASELASARKRLDMYEQSTAISEVSRQSASLMARTAALRMLRNSRELWMPWIKTVMATLPENGSIAEFEIIRRWGLSPDEAPMLHARIDGLLSDGELPHELIYRDWLTQLRGLSGSAERPDLQTRDLFWKGRHRSAFSINIETQPLTVDGRLP